MLILLALGLGGGEEETTGGGGVTPISCAAGSASTGNCIDEYTTPVNLTGACNTLSDTVTAVDPSFIFGEDRRMFVGATTGAGTLTVTSGDGTITIDNTASTTTCDVSTNLIAQYPEAGVAGTPLNLSNKTISGTILEVTGTWTGCFIQGNLGFTSFFFPDPLVTGNYTFTIPSGATAVSQVTGVGCLDPIPAGGKLVLGSTRID